MVVAERSHLADNAFRVLGLPVSATDREIRRRAQELRLRLELEGNPPTALARIRAAESTLEDPVGRLREELYWVHLTPDPIPTDIDFADAAASHRAVGRLAPLVNQGSDAAMHDVAVIRHGAVLAAEHATVEHWARALMDWRQVWQHEPFWFRMNLRAEQLGDPRANNSAVSALRAELPPRVLGPLATEVARLLERGADADASQLMRVILDSGFPTLDLEAARDRAVAELVTLTRDAIRLVRERLAFILSENENRAVYQRALALNHLVGDADQQVAPRVGRLKRLDINNTEVRRLADDAAELYKILSVQLHNEANDLDGALIQIERAERLAVSESTKQNIAEGLRIVRSHIAERSVAVAVNSPVPRATSGNSQSTWLWAVIVGLVMLIWLGISGSSSGRKITPTSSVAQQPAEQGANTSMASGASAKPAPTRPPVPNSPSASERRQLTVLEAEIESARSDTATREKRLSAKETDLASIKARLDSIKTRYQATGAPPEVVREYDALRDQFNVGVDEYNQELAAYKVKRSDANGKVDEYNALLKTVQR